MMIDDQGVVLEIQSGYKDHSTRQGDEDRSGVCGDRNDADA